MDYVIHSYLNWKKMESSSGNLRNQCNIRNTFFFIKKDAFKEQDTLQCLSRDKNDPVFIVYRHTSLHIENLRYFRYNDHQINDNDFV